MIGFPPKHHTSFSLQGTSVQAYYTYACMALESLDWHISFATTEYIIAFTNFSWRSWNEQITIHITPGMLEITSESTGAQIIDFGKNKSNLHLLTETIDSIATSTSEVATEQHFQQYQQQFADLNFEHEGAYHLTHKRRIIKGFTKVFVPVKGYFITPVLVSLNVFIFVLLTALSIYNGSDILPFDITPYANYKLDTLAGQPWRLFSCLFVHFDALHLFFNMYFLVIAGLYLESMLGSRRFLLAYLLSGLGASLASLWWNDYVVSAGSSGAILGLYGVIIAIISQPILEKQERKSLFISIGILIALQLLIGFRKNSSTDNASHIGGILTGYVLGWCYYPSLKRPKWLQGKMVTFYGTLVVGAIAGIITYQNMSRDIFRYQEILDTIDHNRQMAFGIYSMPTTFTREQQLRQIKDNGIYYWDENLRLLDEATHMHLSKKSQRHNQVLIQYNEIQRRIFVFQYKRIDESTQKYNQAILDARADADDLALKANY
ncbi:rhomboid protease GluP [Chitinophaga skermanii]|uniref:Rhomboid protease GluP n=1 Tax=Chitinophaga skermanii TaxID=331697 RepID=A0A327Q2Q7_9BACT|nr:rhomboid family intramembrane serine protease [Chitinophaga skermanii]RAI97482.1 rhomboid protease GluP [Chitinophaga skermanii]